MNGDDDGAAEDQGAQPWVPAGAGVGKLRAAAESCRGCELWQDATQVVFSRGPARARMMLVGEQPGDREDLEGEPFVGPAGRVLQEALGEAGIDEEAVYLTNAVKHFRFERRGKRRIHEKPAVSHIVACRPWLEAEIAAVRPAVVVALGATAARSLRERTERIGDVRGQVLETSDPSGTPLVVTVHPSSLLRLRDADDREAGRRAFVADLRTAAALLG
ncbi:UdgX family uracil-DNA binding protein [Microbacterium sp. 22242]|uniref:UdgX family uracil-DNA binding protein n=1 Tax=Microbacterium sp. 22242 TaxID=3453896 RepID=UPI003F8469AF